MERFLAGVLFGFVMGGIVTTGVFGIWKDAGREKCEAANNVYRCEYVGQWQPAPPKQD